MIDIESLDSIFDDFLDEVSVEKTYKITPKMTVTLRSLVPEEEIAALKEAKSAIDLGDDDDPATFSDYREKLKLGALCRSIIGINDIFFREDRIETGEEVQTRKGTKKVSIERHVYLREKIKRWPSPIIGIVYEYYDDLTNEMNMDAAQYVKFDPVKIDKELERIDFRKEELLKRKEKIEKGKGQSFFDEQRKKILQRDNLEKGLKGEEKEKILYNVTQNRKREKEENIPKTAPPPPSRPQQEETQPRARVDMGEIRNDSLIDWNDPNASIAAEEQKIIQQRREREDRKSSASVERSYPPRNLQSEVEKVAFEAKGTIEGVEAYSFNQPKDITLSKKDTSLLKTDESSEEQSVNRRFVPPNRR